MKCQSQNTVEQRFLTSYGAWTVLMFMLDQIEFLQLQALCRFTYKVGISRAQTRLNMDGEQVLAAKFGFRKLVLYTRRVFETKFSSEIITNLQDIKYGWEGMNILMGTALYIFQKNRNLIMILKLENFHDPDEITVTPHTPVWHDSLKLSFGYYSEWWGFLRLQRVISPLLCQYLQRFFVSQFKDVS